VDECLDGSFYGFTGLLHADFVNREFIAYIPLFYATGSFLFKPYIRGAGTNNFFDFHWNEIQLLSH